MATPRGKHLGLPKVRCWAQKKAWSSVSQMAMRLVTLRAKRLVTPRVMHLATPRGKHLGLPTLSQGECTNFCKKKI